MGKKRNIIIIVLLLSVSTVVVTVFLKDFKKEIINVPVAVEVDPWKIDSNYTASIDIQNLIASFGDSLLSNNSDQFRKGHVKTTELQNYLTKTEYGFIIDLKSNSPITTPSISNGMLIVSGGFSSKNVFAFDPKTGLLVWAIELDDDGPSSPSINDSIAIINTESCTVFALNLFSGEQIWSYFLGDPLISSPTLTNGTVYTVYPKPMDYINFDSIAIDSILHTASHPLIAMNSVNGEILWQTWLDGDIITTIVSDSSHLFLTSFAGTMFKVNKTDGAIEGALDLKSTSFPSIAGDKIFLTRRTDDSTGVKESIAILNKDYFGFIREYGQTDASYLDTSIQNHTKLKEFSTKLDQGNNFFTTPYTSGWFNSAKTTGMTNVSSMQSYIGSAPIFKNELLYNVMGDKIICSNPKTEKIVWQRKIEGNLAEVGGHLATAPIIVEDKLISVTHDGLLLILSIDDGLVIMSKKLNYEVRNQPIVYEGNIIIPTSTGELVFVETNDESIDGWYMFLKNQKHLIN